jgi:hypothetical protein
MRTAIPSFASFQRLQSRTITLCLMLLALSLSSCNVIDIVTGQGAKISNMTPGGDIGGGGMNCWLTLEFKGLPEGADARDVRVRFESAALEQPAEFNWAFIASNDKISAGDTFGSGYHNNSETTPGTDPPLGQPIKARFPLKARSEITDAPSPLYLKAELYWGGKKRDSAKRTIEHVYSHTPNGYF